MDNKKFIVVEAHQDRIEKSDKRGRVVLCVPEENEAKRILRERVKVLKSRGWDVLQQTDTFAKVQYANRQPVALAVRKTTPHAEPASHKETKEWVKRHGLKTGQREAIEEKLENGTYVPPPSPGFNGNGERRQPLVIVQRQESEPESTQEAHDDIARTFSDAVTKYINVQLEQRLDEVIEQRVQAEVDKRVRAYLANLKITFNTNGKMVAETAESVN